MGREVRRVPATWEHPKKQGQYVAMHERFPYCKEEVEEGLREGWLKGEGPHYNIDVMPQWPESERTHWQMYENTSEGTPISPVMATPEELAKWLAINEASACGRMTATEEQWLNTIRRGSAPSMVLSGGKLESGVAAL